MTYHTRARKNLVVMSSPSVESEADKENFTPASVTMSINNALTTSLGPANLDNEMLQDVIACMERVEVQEDDCNKDTSHIEPGCEYRFKITMLEKQLAEKCQHKKDLQKELEMSKKQMLPSADCSSQQSEHDSVPDGSVAHPSDTCYVKELAICGRLNWELTWKEISTSNKVKVYQLACEKQPFLKWFRNDWATEEIIKQYFKN
ncbi:hypothetical protein BDQ17DRAFT_1337015 [Cyathus striatus]|nr:hypothetical protein BDQ17DRAFT_1337015 [Cyathus striatus]